MHVVGTQTLQHIGLAPPSPRSFLRRLSVHPSTQRRHGGQQPTVNTGSQAAILEDVAATWEPTLQRPSMDEQRNMPRRVHRRRRGSLAGSALRVLLGVLLFVTDALGVSQRARSAWARFMKHASSVSGRWAERLAAGRQMTRKLSAVALNTLGMRMSSNKERVAGLLRRAMSAESRLDTCGAIRCYQVRARPVPGLHGSRRVSFFDGVTSPTQAANELVPDDSEPLVGLAKCISDRGADQASATRGAGVRSEALVAPATPYSSRPAFPPRQCLSRTYSTTGSWHALWRPRQRACRSRCGRAGESRLYCATLQAVPCFSADARVRLPAGHSAEARQPARVLGVRHLAGQARCVRLTAADLPDWLTPCCTPAQPCGPPTRRRLRYRAPCASAAWRR